MSYNSIDTIISFSKAFFLDIPYDKEESFDLERDQFYRSGPYAKYLYVDGEVNSVKTDKSILSKLNVSGSAISSLIPSVDSESSTIQGSDIANTTGVDQQKQIKIKYQDNNSYSLSSILSDTPTVSTPSNKSDKRLLLYDNNEIGIIDSLNKSILEDNFQSVNTSVESVNMSVESLHSGSLATVASSIEKLSKEQRKSIQSNLLLISTILKTGHEEKIKNPLTDISILNELQRKSTSSSSSTHSNETVNNSVNTSISTLYDTLAETIKSATDKPPNDQTNTVNPTNYEEALCTLMLNLYEDIEGIKPSILNIALAEHNIGLAKTILHSIKKQETLIATEAEAPAAEITAEAAETAAPATAAIVDNVTKEAINRVVGLKHSLLKSKDKDDITPAHLVCSLHLNSLLPQEDYSLFDLIIDDTIVQEDIDGVTPFHMLCLSPNEKIKEVLTKHKKQINKYIVDSVNDPLSCVDSLGNTPFHNLFLKGSSSESNEIIEMFSQDLSPDSSQNTSNTIDSLLKMLDIQNLEGKTPLDYLTDAQKTPINKILKINSKSPVLLESLAAPDQSTVQTKKEISKYDNKSIIYLKNIISSYNRNPESSKLNLEDIKSIRERFSKATPVEQLQIQDVLRFERSKIARMVEIKGKYKLFFHPISNAELVTGHIDKIGLQLEKPTLNQNIEIPENYIDDLQLKGFLKSIKDKLEKDAKFHFQVKYENGKYVLNYEIKKSESIA